MSETLELAVQLALLIKGQHRYNTNLHLTTPTGMEPGVPSSGSRCQLYFVAEAAATGDFGTPMVSEHAFVHYFGC